MRMGDEITVMVTDIDDQGKIRLSRQAVLEGWTAEEAADTTGVPVAVAARAAARGGGGRPYNDRGGSRDGGDRNRDKPKKY